MTESEITRMLYGLDLGSGNCREVLIAMWSEVLALRKQVKELQKTVAMLDKRTIGSARIGRKS